MNRPIIIDVTINNEVVCRYRAFHAPRIQETITSFTGELKGTFKVVGVDHLLGVSASSFDFEKEYCQLVTVEVVEVLAQPKESE